MQPQKSLGSREEPDRSERGYKNINFSSGPCAKPKNWIPPTREALGRSHRSRYGLKKIQETIALMKKILNIPGDYFVGIVSGSDSGAMGLLLWNLLGSRGVDIDVFAACVFGKVWAHEVEEELGITNVRIFHNEFPNLCDPSGADPSHDLVFCWTSTTSGASYYNADWISDNRSGLTICDATSAAFACDLDWRKLDATSFSWQKALGGEAGLGTIVLGPRAIERLQTYSPSWPIPRIFRIVTNGEVNFKLFEGYVINTPSMMCIEDFCNSLRWADSIGGMPALKQKIEANYGCLKRWIEQQEQPKLFDFIVKEDCRAHHIGCLNIFDERYLNLSKEDKWQFLRKVEAECDREGSGRDFVGHSATEPHIRIWMGPTIDPEDLKAFLPRMDAVCRRFLDEL